jgi:hypothetical protein
MVLIVDFFGYLCNSLIYVFSGAAAHCLVVGLGSYLADHQALQETDVSIYAYEECKFHEILNFQ